jgi:hypothetical protein
MQIIYFIELVNKSLSVCLIILIIKYLKVIYIKYHKNLIELVNKYIRVFFARTKPIGSRGKYLFVIL